MIYASNNGNLQIESTDFAGGRINLVENTSTNALSQDIQYHHKDHLGSVRAITDNTGSVIEQNAYYPFGSRHTFGNTYAQTTNRFKFNGKEEQTTGNLNYLDYGARMYDSNIGRWLVQDPLSEKYYAYSQYSFSGNNPILNIDNDGKAWDTFIDAAFLIYDLGSALYNHIIGEHNKAKQNWKDVGIDAASMIIPGVAAPMMKGVGKVANKLDNAADAGKGMKNADIIDAKKFNGNYDTNSTTSKEAFRKAKDQNGVPRSQQPDKMIKPNTPEGNEYRLDNRNVKIYEFTNSKGETVLIRQDKSVNYGDGHQPEHFNAGLKQDIKLKQHHNYGL